MIGRASARATVFDCVAYGAYSFETDRDLIYRTNFTALVQFVELLAADAASRRSSTPAAPPNTAQQRRARRRRCVLQPNSHYAVSKVAASDYITFAGQDAPAAGRQPAALFGLRPAEDASRLIPNLVRKGLDGDFPPFVDPDTSRDFVYVDDVCAAFIMAAARDDARISTANRSTSAPGSKTTIARSRRGRARRSSRSRAEPVFGDMAGRAWDLPDWYAAPGKAEALLGWTRADHASPTASSDRRLAALASNADELPA